MRTFQITTLGFFLGVGAFGCSGDLQVDRFEAEFSANDNVHQADALDTRMLADKQAENSQPVSERTFKLELRSFGVSSAILSLNDQDLYRPSNFHNKDFSTVTEVKLADYNKVVAELRGSPGDQLCFRFFEVTRDDQDREVERDILEHCLKRSAGAPNRFDDNVDLNEEE